MRPLMSVITWRMRAFCTGSGESRASLASTLPRSIIRNTTYRPTTDSEARIATTQRRDMVARVCRFTWASTYSRIVSQLGSDWTPNSRPPRCTSPTSCAW